jgi:hypothetical protein
MLYDPAVVRAPQRRDFRLKLCRQRRGRAVAGRGRNLRPNAIGEIVDDDRPVRAFQEAQGREDHPLLKGRVVRRTKRPPQFERHPQRARRLSVLGLRPNQADRDRRDPLFLQIMPERAHGARAERSNRREDDGVDPVRF